jgi:hypothetical protein
MYYPKPNNANWVDIFGTSEANTCVKLFHEKFESSFELFVPVLRSPARLITHPWYTRKLLNLENLKARAFKYSFRTGKREVYERLRAEHRDLYSECYASKQFFDFANYKRKTVGYPSSMRYYGLVGDCPADTCELFAHLFESVYNVDTCNADTEVVSGPSDGCGLSGIRLRISD